MNTKIWKSCRYLVAVAFVLEGLSSFIYIIYNGGTSTYFLHLLSDASNILIGVALFVSIKTPFMIGCGIQGFVSVLNIFCFVFNGGDIFDPSVILWLATAVCYVLIAVSLSQETIQEKIIPIAIIVGIVGAGLHYFLCYTEMLDSIDWIIFEAGTDISFDIKTYVCLLIGILALEEKNVPIADKKFISASAKNPIETITKLKELLDIGAISQEEFDEKKKNLLNL